MKDPLDELLELEHAGWRSLCDGTGASFYGKVMASDARMVLADGTVMTRSAVVDALDNAPPWDSYEITHPQLVAIGADVAALVYTGTGHRHDGDDFTAIMTSTYLRDESDWKLVIYQQTATP